MSASRLIMLSNRIKRLRALLRSTASPVPASGLLTAGVAAPLLPAARQLAETMLRQSVAQFLREVSRG